jgi:hypothetical protein
MPMRSKNAGTVPKRMAMGWVLLAFAQFIAGGSVFAQTSAGDPCAIDYSCDAKTILQSCKKLPNLPTVKSATPDSVAFDLDDSLQVGNESRDCHQALVCTAHAIDLAKGSTKLPELGSAKLMTRGIYNSLSTRTAPVKFVNFVRTTSEVRKPPFALSVGPFAQFCEQAKNCRKLGLTGVPLQECLDLPRDDMARLIENGGIVKGSNSAAPEPKKPNANLPDQDTLKNRLSPQATVAPSPEATASAPHLSPSVPSQETAAAKKAEELAEQAKEVQAAEETRAAEKAAEKRAAEKVAAEQEVQKRRAETDRQAPTSSTPPLPGPQPSQPVLPVPQVLAVQTPSTPFVQPVAPAPAATTTFSRQIETGDSNANFIIAMAALVSAMVAGLVGYGFYFFYGRGLAEPQVSAKVPGVVLAASDGEFIEPPANRVDMSRLNASAKSIPQGIDPTVVANLQGILATLQGQRRDRFQPPQDLNLLISHLQFAAGEASQQKAQLATLTAKYQSLEKMNRVVETKHLELTKEKNKERQAYESRIKELQGNSQRALVEAERRSHDLVEQARLEAQKVRDAAERERITAESIRAEADAKQREAEQRLGTAQVLMKGYNEGLPPFMSEHPFSELLERQKLERQQLANDLDVSLRAYHAAAKGSDIEAAMTKVYEVGLCVFNLYADMGLSNDEIESSADQWKSKINELGQGRYTVFVPVIGAAYEGDRMTGPARPPRLVSQIRGWGVVGFRDDRRYVDKRALVA